MQFAITLILLTAFATPSIAAPVEEPGFGPNTLIFNPSMPAAEIQAQIDKVYAVQQHSEFGSARYALLFLPGEYHVDIPVGFYTEVFGLGATPDAVHITGNVHSDASLPRNNATCTFWRAAEGFSVTPTGGATSGTMKWAVSQAIPFRRMHILGNLVLHQDRGWASGGWISDSLIDGNVDSGSQQQWIARNSEWHSWTGANWNMVFVGIKDPPPGEWPAPPYTKALQPPSCAKSPFSLSMLAATISFASPSFKPTARASPGTAGQHRELPSHSQSSSLPTPATQPQPSTPNSPRAKISSSRQVSMTSPNPSASPMPTPSSSASASPG
jgi:hypothetical protein